MTVRSYPAAAERATRRLDTAGRRGYAPLPERSGSTSRDPEVYVQVLRVIHRIALCCAAFSLTACGRGGGEPSNVIPREKFVRANVAVRSLPDGAPASQRAEVLRRHGVTERQMKAWVRAQSSRDPETLAKAWEEIAFKLDSLGGVPPGGVLPPSAGGTPPPPAGGPVPAPRPTVDAGRRMPGRPPPPIRRRPSLPPDSLARTQKVQ
jgi:hypothetical protein